MRRRNKSPRKKIVILLFPLLVAAFLSVAYGTWIDYVAVNITLVASHQPQITVSSSILNVADGTVELLVDNSTKTIQDSYPNPLLILINITNSGLSPVTKLTVNDTLPQDWAAVQPPSLQCVRQDGNVLTVNPEQFSAQYDQTTETLTVSVMDMKAALGRYLNENETILITLSTTYALVGTGLPQGYETSTIVYTNTVTATAYITGWQSQPTSATSIFTTYIYWV